MENENLDFLIFNSIDHIEDNERFGIIVDEMYYIVQYTNEGNPVIELDDGSTFEVFQHELEYVTVYYEDFTINENYSDSTEEDKTEYKPLFDINKYFGYEAPKVKKVKKESDDDLSNKEKSNLHNLLNEIIIDNAINTALKNKDITALKSISKVLRRNKFKQR